MNRPVTQPLGRLLSGLRSLFRTRAKGLVFSWQEGLWAQRLQFQNLLVLLRANKNQFPFDAQRMKTIEDFQRQVPVSFWSQQQNPSAKPWNYPAQLTIDSFETQELPHLIREAQRLAKKSGTTLQTPPSRPILVIDRPLNTPVTASPNQPVSKKKAKAFIAEMDFLSQLLETTGENAWVLSELENLLKKKPYRGFVALSQNLRDSGIPFELDESFWLKRLIPALEFAILDCPQPKDKPAGVVWIETLAIRGSIWARVLEETNRVKGFPRAGLFWEFIPPETNPGAVHTQRYWLGNVPTHRPMELVLSSCQGFLACRTGTIISLIDRNKAVFQTIRNEAQITSLCAQGFLTSQHADHQPRCDTGEGWPEISPHNSW